MDGSGQHSFVRKGMDLQKALYCVFKGKENKCNSSEYASHLRDCFHEAKEKETNLTEL